jgi:hypothetical protein
LVPRPSAYDLYSLGDPLRDQLSLRLDSTERMAIREICELGSFEVVDGKTYLVAPVASWVRDVLATFEAEREDVEDDNVDLECDTSDLDQDLEPDCGGRAADSFSPDFGSKPVAPHQDGPETRRVRTGLGKLSDWKPVPEIKNR